MKCVFWEIYITFLARNLSFNIFLYTKSTRRFEGVSGLWATDRILRILRGPLIENPVYPLFISLFISKILKNCLKFYASHSAPQNYAKWHFCNKWAIFQNFRRRKLVHFWSFDRPFWSVTPIKSPPRKN